MTLNRQMPTLPLGSVLDILDKHDSDQDIRMMADALVLAATENTEYPRAKDLVSQVQLPELVEILPRAIDVIGAYN